MFTGYMKIFLQNLLRNRLYSAINIFGLSVGFIFFIFICLYIRHELSFDKFHQDADRIYRLDLNFDNGGTLWAGNTNFLVPLLRENYPQIEAAARLKIQSVSVARGDLAFREAGFRLVDPAFFELFSFRWLEGDPATALQNENTLVLTESAAGRFFQNADALGKTLLVNDERPMTVAGVIADLPDNTHLNGTMFTSIETGYDLFGEEAISGVFNFYTYVKLIPGADMENLLPAFTETLMTRMSDNFQGRTELMATRLPDVHFSPYVNSLSVNPGSWNLIYSFSAIAAAILIIAGINFMNLSTARSSGRAVEVGMRKTAGAGRQLLVAQFMAESMCLSLLAMLIAIAAVELLLPFFRNFVGKDVQFSFFEDPWSLASAAGVSIALGLSAGSYPAFFLSAFKPAKVLKGDVNRGQAGLLFRNLLVIGQFSISIALIVCTAVIYTQMRYAGNIELGYNKDQIVVLDASTTQSLGPQWDAMKTELLRHPGISHVAGSGTIPGPAFGTPAWFIRYEGGEDTVDLNLMSVDFDFIEAYQMELIAGRAFNRELTGGAERNSGDGFILNEAALRRIGWTADEAVGKLVGVGPDPGPMSEVIGVVGDAHFGSLKSAQSPLLYFIGRSDQSNSVFSFNYASVRLNGNDTAGALAHIDSTWEQFIPGLPVVRRFLNQDFASMYQAEEKQGELLGYFSGVTIIIACLGLYGLACFNVQRRTREIGVRKVFGSSVMRIVLLLTNDFSKLVLIANVIAWPLAYVAMQRWLENFAYRIDLTPLIFIGSGLIALCVAWVTVGGTAAKAASRKPVLALRYE